MTLPGFGGPLRCEYLHETALGAVLRDAAAASAGEGAAAAAGSLDADAAATVMLQDVYAVLARRLLRVAFSDLSVSQGRLDGAGGDLAYAAAVKSLAAQSSAAPSATVRNGSVRFGGGAGAQELVLAAAAFECGLELELRAPRLAALGGAAATLEAVRDALVAAGAADGSGDSCGGRASADGAGALMTRLVVTRTDVAAVVSSPTLEPTLTVTAVSDCGGSNGGDVGGDVALAVVFPAARVPDDARAQPQHAYSTQGTNAVGIFYIDIYEYMTEPRVIILVYLF